MQERTALHLVMAGLATFALILTFQRTTFALIPLLVPLLLLAFRHVRGRALAFLPLCAPFIVLAVLLVPRADPHLYPTLVDPTHRQPDDRYGRHVAREGDRCRLPPDRRGPDHRGGFRANQSPSKSRVSASRWLPIRTTNSSTSGRGEACSFSGASSFCWSSTSSSRGDGSRPPRGRSAASSSGRYRSGFCSSSTA